LRCHDLSSFRPHSALLLHRSCLPELAPCCAFHVGPERQTPTGCRGFIGPIPPPLWMSFQLCYNDKYRSTVKSGCQEGRRHRGGLMAPEPQLASRTQRTAPLLPHQIRHPISQPHIPPSPPGPLSQCWERVRRGSGRLRLLCHCVTVSPIWGYYRFVFFLSLPATTCAGARSPCCTRRVFAFFHHPTHKRA